MEADRAVRSVDDLRRESLTGSAASARHTTHESRRNMALGTVEQIATVLSGNRSARVLNPDDWDAFRERHARIAPG